MPVYREIRMKQYARIFNQYKYQMQKRPDDALWPRDGNIGDCIQSLAIENLYRKIGIAAETLTLINRDDIRTYRGGGVLGMFCPCKLGSRIMPVFFLCLGRMRLNLFLSDFI